MSIEKLTRELGKAIQQDERYLAMRKAVEANEQDTALNELMSKIQLIQVSYQHEASKENPDEGKMKAYDEEFRGVYSEITSYRCISLGNNYLFYACVTENSALG